MELDRSIAKEALNCRSSSSEFHQMIVCLNSSISPLVNLRWIVERIITNPLVQLKSLWPAPKHELCSNIVYESKRIIDSSKLPLHDIRGKLQN